jgi:hypothetical protein
MKGQRWTAGVFALLLFFGGAAAGILGDHYYSASVVSAKTTADMRHRYLSEMESTLKLSTAQVTALETIMDETKAKYRAVRDSYRPAMLEIKNEHTARIKSILTAQQIPAYEKLLSEREQRAREQDERDRRDEQRRAEARRTQAGH